MRYVLPLALRMLYALPVCGDAYWELRAICPAVARAYEGWFPLVYPEIGAAAEALLRERLEP